MLKRQRSGDSRLRAMLQPNTYLTDECKLFRCLGWDGPLVLLEDCATLEAIACSTEELSGAGMRPVTPAR